MHCTINSNRPKGTKMHLHTSTQYLWITRAHACQLPININTHHRLMPCISFGAPCRSTSAPSRATQQCVRATFQACSWGNQSLWASQVCSCGSLVPGCRRFAIGCACSATQKGVANLIHGDAKHLECKHLPPAPHCTMIKTCVHF